MITIKDIAKKAGVAQGTVSNVLNNKGNVSSDKIKRVLDAAHELGYIPNEQAAVLRKGNSKSLTVIMPDSKARQYEDFYVSFKTYSLLHGYKVSRILINENAPESELEALSEALSLQTSGLACISSIASTEHEQMIPQTIRETPLQNLIFVDRCPSFPSHFIGFDYRIAGKEMARTANQQGYRQICLITGNLQLSCESKFYNGFMSEIDVSFSRITHIQTDAFRKNQNIMQIFNEPFPHAFFISNYGLAESVKDICASFCPEQNPKLYTISPVFTMPEKDFIKYKMNYRQLGKLTAEYLIENDSKTPKDCYRKIVTGDGFRDWYANILVPDHPVSLNVITLDSPESYIMKHLSRLYTQKTGIQINICIFSYEEIYEVYNSISEQSNYDILRLDVTWMSWFAEKLLTPLKEIDPDIDQCFDAFVDGTADRYARVRQTIYALPFTPSSLLLYYRKDLFENPIYQRMFYEQYRCNLEPPTTFESFNRIAAFFTRSLNEASPVDFGTTITLGSTGVAGSEYLARLFSYQPHLYDNQLLVNLQSETAVKAMYDLIACRQYTSNEYASWWVSTAHAFAEGNYAMAPLYSNYAGDLLGHSSKIIGKIGFSFMPGNTAVLGGGSLGIYKHSKNSETALSFIKWLCSEPVASAAALLGSTSPCKKTYDNYEVIQNAPWMKTAKHCFTTNSGLRTPSSFPLPFDERKFLNIIGMAVKNSYNGICTPEEALQLAQKQYASHFYTSYQS